MANLFSVIGNAGNTVVEASELIVVGARVLKETTRETGKLLIKEVKTTNKTWEKNKRIELKKMKYSDAEINQIMKEIKAEMAALDL